MQSRIQNCSLVWTLDLDLILHEAYLQPYNMGKINEKNRKVKDIVRLKFSQKVTRLYKSPFPSVSHLFAPYKISNWSHSSLASTILCKLGPMVPYPLQTHSEVTTQVSQLIWASAVLPFLIFSKAFLLEFLTLFWIDTFNLSLRDYSTLDLFSFIYLFKISE